MAKRYVEKVPHVAYSAIGINPTVFKYSVDGSKAKLSQGMAKNGDWLLFNDMMPEIQFKAIYEDGMRKIHLDVAEAETETHTGDGAEVFGLVFHANIHRDITQAIQQERISGIKTILDQWQNDLNDFYGLIDKFDIKRFV